MTPRNFRRHLLAPAAFTILAALFLVGASHQPASAEAKVIACAPRGPANVEPKPNAPIGLPIGLEVSKGRLVRLDQPANSVFVADPDIADVQVKSPALVYVYGKSAGETTLYAVGENDEVLLCSNVTVHYNSGRLAQAIHQLSPRSTVTVSSIDDSLVLEGTVFSAAESEDIRRLAARFVPDPKQLINSMRVDAPNQVNIRVRVAEMSRTVIKQFGFNWENFFGNANFLIGIATGHSFLTSVPALGAAIAPGAFSTRAIVPGTTTTTNSVSGGVRTTNANLNVLLDALEDQGLITILAEPNLTAISGESASFLAGGEFPIPVPQGNNTITIDFKKFGVSLNFVATITSNGRISMHVAPEVSELSNNGAIIVSNISVPALTTRRAETTVDLASGDSFAIAGLLQNNVTQDISKFPWLGDVPVLGALFRSSSFQRNETELVIIATPYIVRPTQNANALRAPTDGYFPASDQSRVLNGDFYRPQVLKEGTAPVTRSGTTLIGPAGFDLD